MKDTVGWGEPVAKLQRDEPGSEVTTAHRLTDSLGHRQLRGFNLCMIAYDEVFSAEIANRGCT